MAIEKQSFLKSVSTNPKVFKQLEIFMKAKAAFDEAAVFL